MVRCGVDSGETREGQARVTFWPEQASLESRERAAGAKVAFFDIDGTLLPMETRVMPPSTVRALDLLQSRGVRIVVCTGRVLERARTIRCFHDFDGWLCANGGYCVLDGELVRAEELDRGDVRTAVSEAAEGGYGIALFYEDHMTVGTPGGDRSVLNGSWGHSRAVDYSELDLERPVYQMDAAVPPERDAEVLAHLPHLKSVRWTERFMDIVPADGGKRAGMIAQLRSGAGGLGALGASREQCLAFGDGSNDRDMIAYAGVGVAMGNGADEVKAVADYVTSACDADGVWNALVALGLG